jgi:uncharacterized protein (TIGR00304 family)
MLQIKACISHFEIDRTTCPIMMTMQSTQELNSGNLLTRYQMRILRALGLVLLAIGILTTVLGIITGDVQVGLALFFIPVLQSTTSLGGIAIVLIFIGIVIIILDSIYSVRNQGYQIEGAAETSPAGRTDKPEMGGVVLIGPIPIVFGTSNRAALIALIVAAALITFLMLGLLFFWT